MTQVGLRRLVRLAVIVWPCVCLAQVQPPRPPERTAAGPDIPAAPDIGVYYRLGAGWQVMLPEIVDWQASGIPDRAAAKSGVNGHLFGPHSRTWITARAEIVIHAPGGVPIHDYQLLRLHEGSDYREFGVGPAGRTHSTGTALDLVPFEDKPVSPGVYRVIMPALEAGEYGFLSPGSAASRAGTTVDRIYTFRVDHARTAILTADARGDGIDPRTLYAKPAAAGVLADAPARETDPAVPPPSAPALPQSLLKPMTNRDVIDLKVAGFSDEFVIGKIRTSPGSYQVDTGDVIALKKSNLSEPVIQAIMAAAQTSESGANVQATVEASDVATVQSAHDPPRPGLFSRLRRVLADAPEEHKAAGLQPGAPDPPPPPEFALTPVTIFSKPSGARIFVDGYPAGFTPAVVKLLPGSYKLTLLADGLPPYTQLLTVDPGQVSSVGVALDTSK